MSSNERTAGITTGTITVGGSLCISAPAGALVNSWLLNFVSGSSNTFMVGHSTMAAGYRIGTIPIAIGGGCNLHFNNRDGVTTVIEYVKSLTGLSQVF